MKEEVTIKFQISKTKNTNIRKQGYIRMNTLEDLLGEGSMPNKFPKEALDFRGEQRIPNGGMMERRFRGGMLRRRRRMKSRTDH